MKSEFFILLFIRQYDEPHTIVCGFFDVIFNVTLNS